MIKSLQRSNAPLCLRQASCTHRSGFIALVALLPFCVTADVLEAALQARAALAPQLPKARAAVAATTATARKLRGAVMLTKLAAGVFDIGRAVRMQLTVAAAEQILQQDSAANRAAAQISKAVKQKDAHTMDVQRTGSKGRKQQPSTGTA